MSDFPPSCIHSDGKGLCAACQLEFATDPESWLEFGDHPDGLERWRRLQVDIGEGCIGGSSVPLPDQDIPF